MSEDILVFIGPEYAQQHLAPELSFYEDVSLSKVLHILESQQSLWGKSSGGATLQWCSKGKYEGETCNTPNPERPSLVILFNYRHGFHFRFDIQDEQFIALDPTAKSSRVVHQLGGEPAYFPSASFVSLDTARSIVTSFVRGGRRYSRVKWIESSSFRYDLPNEWKKLHA